MAPAAELVEPEGHEPLISVPGAVTVTACGKTGGFADVMAIDVPEAIEMPVPEIGAFATNNPARPPQL